MDGKYKSGQGITGEFAEAGKGASKALPRDLQSPPVLSVSHLAVTFTQYERGMRRTELPVIRDLCLEVRKGELVAVVGSSGSGKSLLAHAVMGILPYNASVSGEIRYQGEILDEGRLKQLRGREIVLVPQSVSYLDPLMKVGAQLRRGKNDQDSIKRSREALARYGLGPDTQGLYPFELSGGMARRVMIASAFMERPSLVIADEPTPGLHATAARRVMGHFKELAADGAGVILITHDLELALSVADRIVVFYAGTTVEEAFAGDFEREETLRHPYSRALYQAMPEHGFAARPGAQPYVKDKWQGCPYAPRCPYRRKECGSQVPYRPERGGYVRCLGFSGGREADHGAKG